MLNWDDIKRLPQEIVSIGSHGCSHTNLCLLNNNDCYNELYNSYNVIYEKLGYFPDSIAYPNGQFTEEINQMAKNIGYKLAYTCENKPNQLHNDCVLHRYNLYHQSFFKNLIRLLMIRHS